nr:MAG TPA: hypothetical protein [Caudoviricetes sp.]
MDKLGVFKRHSFKLYDISIIILARAKSFSKKIIT